eukprot:PRCOL_00002755-RA
MAAGSLDAARAAAASQGRITSRAEAAVRRRIGAAVGALPLAAHVLAPGALSWNIGGRGVEVPKKYKDFVASKRGQFVRQLLAVGPAVAFAVTCMLAHMRGELTYDVAMQVLVVQLVMVVLAVVISYNS